jgi:hypothetical protein
VKQHLYFLSLILLFISCEKRKTLDAEGLQTVTIGFANASMEMPRFYRDIPVEVLENLLGNSGEPDDLKQLQIQRLELVKAFPAHFIIYTDSTNLANQIWFQKGEHIVLTKHIAQQYLSMLEHQLEEQWNPYGVDYNRMESRYISTPNGQIIKLKYKIYHQDQMRFSTQYLISTRTQTMGIIVNGIDSMDYEDNVRRLKIE